MRESSQHVFCSLNCCQALEGADARIANLEAELATERRLRGLAKAVCEAASPVSVIRTVHPGRIRAGGPQWDFPELHAAVAEWAAAQKEGERACEYCHGTTQIYVDGKLREEACWVCEAGIE